MPLNVVLFEGANASNQLSLWETDGTPGGTSELAPILGAYPGGLSPPAPASAGLNPGNLAGFNGEVLFEGARTNGQFTLWETNGTAAGTVQLTAAALNPNNLTVFQDQVLFNGTDSSGHPELWKTNGTAAGTSELPPSSAPRRRD
jgi:ELWxxDGT repeat protein